MRRTVEPCGAARDGRTMGMKEFSRRREVAVSTASAERHEPFPRYKRRSVDELLREKGSRPIERIEDLAAPGTFESDEEVEEFIAFYRAQRQLGIEE